MTVAGQILLGRFADPKVQQGGSENESEDMHMVKDYP